MVFIKNTLNKDIPFNSLVLQAEVYNHLADFLSDYHKMVMPFGKKAGRLEHMLDHYHAMVSIAQAGR